MALLLYVFSCLCLFQLSPISAFEEPCEGPTCYNPQATINTLIDFGMLFVTKKFTVDGNGSVNIPDIVQSFSTGSGIFQSTGELFATGGTFRDLTTLKRISDVVLKHQNHSFSIESSFELEKASLQFEHYKVRYGILKTDGDLNVNIDGVKLTAKVEIDFNSHPCRVNLITFNVFDLGNINTNLTGLRPFNSIAADIVTGKIEHHVRVTVKDAVAQKLSTLDCEKYRP